MSEIRPACSEDLFVWPCGTYCTRSEYDRDLSYQQMSDDFERVAFGTPRYNEVLRAAGVDQQDLSLNTSEDEARPYEPQHIHV